LFGFYLAKASFLQDMLLGMFVFFVILQKLAFCKIRYSVCLFFYLAKASFFYLAKASFLQDMLLGMFVLFLFFCM
jgi:hypothetical protein